MSLLMQLAQAMGNRSIRTIDLTHTLSEDFPALQLPPQEKLFQYQPGPASS